MPVGSLRSVMVNEIDLQIIISEFDAQLMIIWLTLPLSRKREKKKTLLKIVLFSYPACDKVLVLIVIY